VRTAETLDHFGLGSATDLVIASDDLEMPKPHPEGLRRILDHFGTDPEDAVMVGDSVNDILCAEEAGVGSIAVTWGTRPDRVRTLCHPDHVVDDWVSLDLLLFGETPPEARRAPRLEVSLTP
jgi:phosphoglycolate phosphatase-like HAD superfamily hydrolase